MAARMQSIKANCRKVSLSSDEEEMGRNKELEFERICSKTSTTDVPSEVAGDVFTQRCWVTPRAVLLCPEN